MTELGYKHRLALSNAKSSLLSRNVSGGKEKWTNKEGEGKGDHEIFVAPSLSCNFPSKLLFPKFAKHTLSQRLCLPQSFFFPFRCISFGLLGSSFRAIPKHQKGGEKNRDYRREGQDKRTSCLAAFSDHGRKKRWSLCSTFLSPDASTFFYIHSLSLFSNQSRHLGGP